MPFHVFLSHSSADKPVVEELARRLAKEGIQPWLDKWHLIPGDPWQPGIEKALADSGTCAVFVGPSGLGPWQNEEMRAAIEQRVRESARRFRVIPVLLPGAERAERSSLPTFLAATTWVEFRDSLDDADAFHRLVCGIRGVEPGPGPGQAISEGQCPYQGLRVFDVDDAPFFFGREALVQWLLNEVRPATEGQVVNRFLAIVGASGSGKSSVARAGLVAALKHDVIQGSSRWPVAICRPGPDPLESLAVALSKAVNVGQGASALAELIAALQKNEKTLHLIARQSLPENALNMRLVILVDQFEEIFTLCRKDDLRDALTHNLLYAAKVTQGQTLVILTMRADFYGKCVVNAELAAAFSDHHILVGPMMEDELRQAIEMPAQLVGCELETGLVDLLIQDVRRQPGALPLLQHALLELWNKREGRRLTVRAYQEIGKLEGALQRRADATLKAFSQDDQELCRRTFLRLTQPGEGTEDTKCRASMLELLSLSGASAAEEEIVQKLANASLLTTEGELSDKDAYVEVAHEALIRSWPQLRKWIDADRAGLRTRTRLTEAARDWKNAGRDPTFLYTGARLAVAEEWEASHPGQLSIEEAEFLRCSRESQKQREATELEVARKLAKEQKHRAELSEQREKERKEAAQKLRRRAMVAVGVGVGALMFFVMSVLMWLSAHPLGPMVEAERAKAEQQARIAESCRLAAEAYSALSNYPQRSLLLAVEAVQLGQSLHGTRVAAAEQSLRDTLAAIGGRALAMSHTNTSALGISPDNRWVVPAVSTARLWNLNRKAQVVLRGHAGPVRAVAFSLDNRWLATGSGDGTARLWDLMAQDPTASPLVLRGDAFEVNAVAFSPDSRWLLTGGGDKTARLWDLRAQDPAAGPLVLRGDAFEVNAVAFSSDARWLVTGGETVQLWDLSAKDPTASPLVLRGHKGPTRVVAISADGHWLVTGSDDKTARLWDLMAQDPARPVVLRGHEGGVLAVAFSPDSRCLFAQNDKEKVLFDESGKEEVLFVQSAKEEVHLWNFSTQEQTREPLEFFAEGKVAVFSPDSCWLLTQSAEGTLRLCDIRAQALSRWHTGEVLRGHEAAVRTVAFSSDNRWLVTASEDKTARLWPLQIKDLIDAACAAVGRNFSNAEWQLYFPGQSYHKTFPDLPGPED